MTKKFVYKNGENYARKSYKDFLFDNLPKTDKQINFQRTDFRGSKFVDLDITANFDRADFINCAFKNIKFINTNFGAPEFKNCIFEDIFFSKNTYSASAFIKCSFFNCTFENESIYGDFFNCTFKKTNFITSNFERSTIDTCKFKECKFTDTNFSSLAAEDLTFESTHFKNVAMSINYLFTYFIDQFTNLSEITFEYRGSKTYLTEEVSDNYFQELFKERRYYEMFNMSILFNNESNLPQILKLIISKREVLDHQLLRCVECIIFYFNKGILSFEMTCNLLNILKSTNQNFDLESINIHEKIYILEKLITTLSVDRVKLIDNHAKDFKIRFRCAIDQEEEAKEYISNLFHSILDPSMGLDSSKIELINAEKGSWILTYAVTASVVVYTIKKIQEIILNSHKLKESKLRIQFIESNIEDYTKRLQHNCNLELESKGIVGLEPSKHILNCFLSNYQPIMINNEKLIDKITNIDLFR